VGRHHAARQEAGDKRHRPHHAGAAEARCA
jgi:hypothetical protein